jgi:hypothetical protein
MKASGAAVTSESLNHAVPEIGNAKRENRVAVAGLIASNIGFVVPFAGGVVGIILGIVGLRKSRDLRVGGRGMAIAAIIVGILSIATSAAVMWSIYVNSKVIDASEQSRQFETSRLVIVADQQPMATEGGVIPRCS